MKTTLLLFMIGFACIAQEPTSSTGRANPALLNTSSYTPLAFELVDTKGETKMMISMEGEVTFGKNVKPSDAAKEFAVYLKQYMKCESPAQASGEKK